ARTRIDMAISALTPTPHATRLNLSNIIFWTSAPSQNSTEASPDDGFGKSMLAGYSQYIAGNSPDALSGWLTTRETMRAKSPWAYIAKGSVAATQKAAKLSKIKFVSASCLFIII